MLTAVDAFCGAGGLGLGLQRARFSIVRAFDKDAAAVSTARYNNQHSVLLADALELRGEQLAPEYEPGTLDLAAGGPPCQGFSAQNKRRSPDDLRNGEGDMGEYAYQHNNSPHTYLVLARFSCWDDPNGPYNCDWTFADRDEVAGLLARFPEGNADDR